MKKFEKRYGIKEDEKVKEFHRSRRMFCIKDNQLFIAKINIDYSHAIWFEKEGWDKDLMEYAVRGIIDEEGDIHFYYGYNFNVDEKSEKIFFNYLPKLVKELNIKPTAKIFGGKIKQGISIGWPSKKEYGIVAKYSNEEKMVTYEHEVPTIQKLIIDDKGNIVEELKANIVFVYDKNTKEFVKSICY